jgi:hypothetical protein
MIGEEGWTLSPLNVTLCRFDSGHKERESRPICRVEKEGIYLMEFVEIWVNKGRPHEKYGQHYKN